MAADVRIDGLTVSMAAGGVARPVLEDLEISVPRSSICAIVGRSGCGKTTLLKAVGGILDARSAKVSGSVAVMVDGPVRPAAIGMVFQSSFLMPWCTALENVAMHERIQGRTGSTVALDLLKQVGLGEHGDKYPYELSGGMQQRVALAREFARPLDLLLMDEPFRMLDRVTQEQLVECLMMFWRAVRPTVLLVTHDPGEAVLVADRILVLGAGRICATIDVAAKLPRERSAKISGSSDFQELVECVLDHLRRQ